MSFAKEFRSFISRGNVVDMAVGIIIGAAFGKIVSSFVNDVLMPPLGMLIGGMDFTGFKIVLKQAQLDEAGAIVKDAVTLNYGNFIQTTVDFLIIAFAIFLLIKAMNKLRQKEEQKAAEPAVPPAPGKEELLLTEIRDILKNK
ncbi:MAG TPA: large-conductance mechanosensitive channel protein MscL [Bacteroidia bacterium]|nr:large-conductance mechanosensitive channel protein MscL [Bacteroidia bacterium]HRS58502.1 large-conductance mechanosensitive channel protein MscL [Bacteroidia bacterium]HRU68533.1 large-conductance mechanosensitive channel protein MscL [Bacteroidia bacterium]